MRLFSSPDATLGPHANFSAGSFVVHSQSPRLVRKIGVGYLYLEDMGVSISPEGLGEPRLAGPFKLETRLVVLL